MNSEWRFHKSYIQDQVSGVGRGVFMVSYFRIQRNPPTNEAKLIISIF